MTNETFFDQSKVLGQYFLSGADFDIENCESTYKYLSKYFENDIGHSIA